MSQTFSLDSLSPPQREAVLHSYGPMVIFAGAGSGKTRVITTRIAHLLAEGARTGEILALTFTNKAAAEMRHRVQSMVGAQRSPLITTFHSGCARWLREFASELGFTSEFSIYDDNDCTAALKLVIREINPAGEMPKLVAEFKAFINQAKTHALSPESEAKAFVDRGIEIPSAGLAIYRRYQKYLRTCNGMDFGDLLMNMLLLLRDHAAVRELMQQRFLYVMVDEYQDTNQTQLELIQLLVASHNNLVVVGDDDQSIYSWRGASSENILHFSRLYPTAKTIILGKNYRSSANIVEAASTMIATNRTRAPKELSSAKGPGDPIYLRIESSAETEAWWVADQIQKERDRFPYEQVAIFYRTNSQSRALEEMLRREKIPYAIFGSLEFYDRVEVKDLIGYLRFLGNKRDDLSLLRIINTPTRGIGAKAIESLRTESLRQGVSLWEIINLAAAPGTKPAPKLRYFVDLISALDKELSQTSLGGVIPLLLEATDYSEYLKKKFPEQYDDKIGNVAELTASMHSFAQEAPNASISDWLESITLVRDPDTDSEPGVTLMTLHMAKGLEFERVYICGTEDGLIPHRGSMGSAEKLEEERRLFYVGMTRAKTRLSLCCARFRMTFRETMVNPPSRFLKEIPKNLLLELNDSGVKNRAESRPQQPRSIAESTYESLEVDLNPGALVHHPTYGQGVIASVEHTFGTMRVIVDFSDFGPRKVSPTQLEPA